MKGLLIYKKPFLHGSYSDKSICPISNKRLWTTTPFTRSSIHNKSPLSLCYQFFIELVQEMGTVSVAIQTHLSRIA